MSKPVYIELDRTRELRLGVNKFIKIEEELGKPISEINDSAKDLLTILYHAISDKELTKEQLGNLVDDAGFKYCAKKAVQAINEAIKGGHDEKI